MWKTLWGDDTWECDEEFINDFYTQEFKITKFDPYYNYQEQIEKFYAYEKY